MSQQLDIDGSPLNGGKLYLIQAGTTSTPQNCYQDSGLTIAWPNPITLDSAGRIPQLFCADGSIKIRLTNSAGVQKLVADGLLVVGPSGGGGGGSSVDATTVLATGDFKGRYGTGVLAGFVRCNGRTIGSALSGATERANADAQSLFEYFWGADSNLAVSSGRGASANADWTANKTLTLPDCRGRVLASLDDMGNSAAGRLTASYFGATATTLGAVGGAESIALTLAQLPTGITSSSAITSVTLAIGKYIPQTFNPMATIPVSSTGSLYSIYAPSGAADWTVNNSTLSGTLSGGIISTSNNTSGSAHRTVQPTILLTTYIKL
jgi:hypothetical protein